MYQGLVYVTSISCMSASHFAVTNACAHTKLTHAVQTFFLSE